jgi:mono/diheme cytochrome c family protein
MSSQFNPLTCAALLTLVLVGVPSLLLAEPDSPLQVLDVAPPDSAHAALVEVRGEFVYWSYALSDTLDASYDEVVLPVGHLYRLRVTSEVMERRFLVPELGLDVRIPADESRDIWVRAVAPGTVETSCWGRYCDLPPEAEAPDAFRSTIRVATDEAFDAFVEGVRKPSLDRLSWASYGAALYARHACAVCHDGRAAEIGGELSGIYGTVRESADGRRAVADLPYLSESIRAPATFVVAGRPAAMPAYEMLPSEDIHALSVYLACQGESPPMELFCDPQ